MIAVELLDPKMDAGMDAARRNKHVQSFEQAIQVVLKYNYIYIYNVPSQLLISIILLTYHYQRGLPIFQLEQSYFVGVIDDMLSAYVAWLGGIIYCNRILVYYIVELLYSIQFRPIIYCYNSLHCATKNNYLYSVTIQYCYFSTLFKYSFLY